MTNTARKRRIARDELKFKNDPMIRFYDRTQDWLQTRSRPFFIAAGILVGAVILYLFGSWFFSIRRDNAAQAFAAAYEKYNAPVVDATTSQTGLYYTDENQKWQETAAAFEQLARDYSGYYAATGNYYAGIATLRLNREQGLALLKKAVDEKEQPTSDLAQLAIAESYVAAGDAATALPIYQQLLASGTIPKEAVQTALGRAYEKNGETEKAVAAYFEAASSARANGPNSEAEKRLTALAPDKVKELPQFDPNKTTAIP